MAQQLKGKLVKGPYKPIHRNCAIYFLLTVPGTLNNQFSMDVWWFPTISQVKIWNHPVETTTKNWLFKVPGIYIYRCFQIIGVGPPNHECFPWFSPSILGYPYFWRATHISTEFSGSRVEGSYIFLDVFSGMMILVIFRSRSSRTDDLPQKVDLVREIPGWFEGNLGWWNIMNHLARWNDNISTEFSGSCRW